MASLAMALAMSLAMSLPLPLPLVVDDRLAAVSALISLPAAIAVPIYATVAAAAINN